MFASNGLLLSIILLCKIIDIAWCVAKVFILLRVHVIASSRILNFSQWFSLKNCVGALAPMVITISGFTFHLLLIIFSISA